MIKALLMTTALVVMAGAANAATVTVSPGPENPAYFASTAVGTTGAFSVGTDLWSGTGKVENGTLASKYAAPLGMTNNYMAVFKGGSETVTFDTEQKAISIYWGSIDSGNDFAITIDSYTLTGANLAAMFPGTVKDNGNQLSTLSNQLVTISGLGDFTTATFTSSVNSYEFSLVPVGSSVPEPSTWAMMALGFAGLGYAAFRRNSKGQIAVGAI